MEPIVNQSLGMYPTEINTYAISDNIDTMYQMICNLADQVHKITCILDTRIQKTEGLAETHEEDILNIQKELAKLKDMCHR